MQQVLLVLRSMALFLTAGLLERSAAATWSGSGCGRGGPAGWCCREGSPCSPTVFQPAHFGRVYTRAYSGLFIALSLPWGWWLDSRKPDAWDVAGALICLAGVMIIMYAPRSG